MQLGMLALCSVGIIVFAIGFFVGIKWMLLGLLLYQFGDRLASSLEADRIARLINR